MFLAKSDLQRFFRDWILTSLKIAFCEKHFVRSLKAFHHCGTLCYLMTSYMSQSIEHYAIWWHHICQSIGHYAIWWHHACHNILDTMLSDDTYMSEYIGHNAIWRHHTCQSIRIIRYLMTSYMSEYWILCYLMTSYMSLHWTLHYLMTSYMSQSIGHYAIWWHHT